MFNCLPPRSNDSQCKSLVEKERGCLFTGYTDSDYWQISALKFHYLSNSQKHIVLTPFANPGQFQYAPVRGSVLQKSRSPWPSIPGPSSALQASPTNLCLAREGPHTAPSALLPCSPGRFPSRSPLSYSSSYSKTIWHLFIPNHMVPPYTPDLMDQFPYFMAPSS